MRIAFIIDPPGTLKPAKDSSIAMMRAAHRAGDAIWIIEQPSLHYSPERGVCGEAVRLEIGDDDAGWYG